MWPKFLVQIVAALRLLDEVVESREHFNEVCWRVFEERFETVDEPGCFDGLFSGDRTLGDTISESRIYARNNAGHCEEPMTRGRCLREHVMQKACAFRALADIFVVGSHDHAKDITRHEGPQPSELRGVLSR